jgi:hypothetical protein
MSFHVRIIAFMFLVFVFVAAGCGGSDLPAPVSVTPTAPPTLKQLLVDVVNSGELGSGAEQIRSEIEKLKESDSAKGTDLLADFDKLGKMSDPEQVKAAAKKMADKL